MEKRYTGCLGLTEISREKVDAKKKVYIQAKFYHIEKAWRWRGQYKHTIRTGVPKRFSLFLSRDWNNRNMSPLRHSTRFRKSLFEVLKIPVCIVNLALLFLSSCEWNEHLYLFLFSVLHNSLSYIRYTWLHLYFS